ncbi:YhfC family intramembrane metalloprotease [Sedimentibacter sp. zth1]|uniref:YhfC family intramembrane metalloprotease n=1 Tax=Sedimentibacter sp. zth1 TaxID=2816908 RepID=UPI001A9220BB|nr:YhfC family glutamic-type intramembrane protease [Sedimentibacter sp. zth1]QSX05221.1 YhfC family intramembrane metalloprotease [Sedimentibacter sp. zth1]
MISNSALLALVLDLIICFVIPIAVFIVIQLKCKKAFKAFSFGALAFFISQIVLRIPIITSLLPCFEWYTIFQDKYPYLYWIFLGLTAGIFEEVARFIFIKYFMKKNQRYIDGISFGLGHGAIEAILITGVSFATILVYSIMINNGTFVSNTVSIPKATADAIYTQCINLTFTNAILGGVERIFSMCIHIGLTMIVFIGVRNNKSFIYLIIAILVHGTIDSSIGLMSQMLGFSTIAMEAVFGAIAIVLVIYSLCIKKRNIWQANCEI